MRANRLLTVTLVAVTSFSIAPAGGAVLAVLFGAHAIDGCDAACGCHDDHAEAEDHDHVLAGFGHEADAEGHGSCPEGCDGCRCATTCSVAPLLGLSPTLHHPTASTWIRGPTATGHHGTLVRIFKPPKRSQA